LKPEQGRTEKSQDFNYNGKLMEQTLANIPDSAERTDWLVSHLLERWTKYV